MNTLNKKIFISVIAVLLISLAGFALLSFTMADDTTEIETRITGATDSDSSKTIIDHIIQNSHTGETDKTYHILELTSYRASDLRSMVVEADYSFRNLVINGNKSSNMKLDLAEDTDDFKAIEYICINIVEKDEVDGENVYYVINNDDNKLTSQTYTEEEIGQLINNVDLIYLHDDPNGMFEEGNDISEDVKIALSSYASNGYPLIIDSHNKTQNIVDSSGLTFITLGTNVFDEEGVKYATSKWDVSTSSSAASFMNPANMRSTYSPISGSDALANWITFEDAGSTRYMAKTLTIRLDEDDNELTELFRVGMTEYAGPTKVATETDATETDAEETTEDTSGIDWENTTAYKVEETDDCAVYTYGYISRNRKPDYMMFDTVTLTSEGLDALDNYSLETYDYIIIESGCAKYTSLLGDYYNVLSAAMYARVHILYSSAISSSNGTSSADCTAVNFSYVYNKVATAQDKARFDYVLVCSGAQMSGYAAATTATGVKDIADIINAGKFRGLSGTGSGDSTNVYTVLEIQPSYPIDSTLASLLNNVKGYNDPLYTTTMTSNAASSMTFMNEADPDQDILKQYSNTFYYLRTDSMTDLTSDEITYGEVGSYAETSLSYMLDDGNGNNTVSNYLTSDNMANVTDYYAWTLSKAKIAHATGKKYSEVNVVHMSSSEFCTSQKSLIDNYDAIYIGGNYSGIKDLSNWLSTTKGFYTYNMYYHNGDTYYYNSTYAGYEDTYGIRAGNDLTQDKLEELLEYAKSMPLIISDEVYDAYLKSYTMNGNEQVKVYSDQQEGTAELDPDSNMYKLLKSIAPADLNGTPTLATAYTNTVLLDFEHDNIVRISNPDSTYGTTYGGFVTVFGGKESENYKGETQTRDNDAIDEVHLSTLLSTYARPNLALIESPTGYSEYDSTTWLTGGPLTFKFEVSSGSGDYTTYAYIDDNANGRFDDEDYRAVASGSSGTLTISDIPSTYYGPAYWKVTVVDNQTGCSSSTTGMVKIKRTTQEKMQVNLLQIMPVSANPPVAGEGGTNCTLYLCTECQFGRGLFYTNRNTNDGGKHNLVTYTTQGGGFANKAYGLTTYPRTLGAYEDAYTYLKAYDSEWYDANWSGVTNLGVHEHKFGVVKYYDTKQFGTTTGLDDINTNWFAQISDDYDVNMTILTTTDFEKLVYNVNSKYDALSDDDSIKALATKYAEDAAKYEICYRVMRDIINGTAVTDMKSYEYSIFKSEMMNILTSYNSGYTETAFDTLIEGYRTASANLDAYLLENKSTIAGFSKFYEKMDAPSGLSGTEITEYKRGVVEDEIEFLTNTDSNGKALTGYGEVIEPTNRSYYDIFSMYNNVQMSDTDGKTMNKIGELYEYWRDAKMFEQYFKAQWMENLEYSSVYYIDNDGTSTETTSDTSVSGSTTSESESSSEQNALVTESNRGTIKLSNVFNCIVIGAADNFADTSNKYADITAYNGSSHVIYDANDPDTYTATTALAEYIDADGNMILFHDTLTALIGNSGTGQTAMYDVLSAKFGMDSRHMHKSSGNKQYRDTEFTLTVDGVTTDTYTFKHDVASMNAKITQTAKSKDSGSITITVGEETTTIDSIASTDTGYSVDVTKTGSSLTGLQYKIEEVRPDWGNYTTTVSYGDFDTTPKSILYNVLQMWGNINGDKKVNIETTGSSTSAHAIDITVDYYSCDGNYNATQEDKPIGQCYTNFYLYDSDGNSIFTKTNVGDAVTFTIPATSMSNASYTMGTPTKKSGTLSGFGNQEITVTVVDDSGNPVADETVTYTIDGVEGTATTDENGVATFYRSNYEVTDLTVEMSEEGTVSDYSDALPITITYADYEGNPITGATIVFNDKTEGKTETKYTNDSGVARATIANYDVFTGDSLPLVLDDGYDSEEYFLSALDPNDPDFTSYTGATLTDKTVVIDSVGSNDQKQFYMMHKYSYLRYHVSTVNSSIMPVKDVRSYIKGSANRVHTDKASQTNEGVITLYPFTLGTTLQISPTSNQSFVADVEDDNMTVYYTLSGGTTGTSSRNFAADPGNGFENYFLYQYNNVYYTGAGHTNITGIGRNNNDERRLYINVIVNSARMSTQGPTLYIYDSDSTTDNLKNKSIKQVDDGADNYEMSVSEDVTNIAFSFLPNMSSGTVFKHVSVYWDVVRDGTSNINYDEPTKVTNEDGTTSIEGDVLIFDSDKDTANNVDSGLLKRIEQSSTYTTSGLKTTASGGSTLELSEDYFVFDDTLKKETARIVIKITDSKGNTAIKTLRIVRTPELLGLN